MIIIRNKADNNNAWWYETPEIAYDQLVEDNCWNLTDRDTFLVKINWDGRYNVDTLEIFTADQGVEDDS